MNFQQLLYVIEVDRCKSISHASRNLFVSQPCISSAIKDLEDSLRITIFTRSNSGVKTTELGEAFIRDAKEVIRQAEMLDQKYGQVHNDPAYHFWVAAYPKDSVTHAAIDLVEQCVASSKGLDLNIYGASMSQAIEDVRLKRADVGIVSFYSMFNHVSRQWVMDNELEFHKLSDFSIRIAVDKSHPLAGSTGVTLDDLSDYPCVEASTAIYEFLIEMHEQNGSVPDSEVCSSSMSSRIIRTDNVDLIYELMRNTHAFTFVSYHSRFNFNGIEDFRLLDVDLGDLKEIRGWIKRRDRALSSHEQRFVDEIEYYLLNN
jgi:DNA-binding transcriptional LysR family regulator